MLHFLNRKREGNYGWSAIKLDMTKAYDRIELDYLREILTRLGFANDWIDLVIMCVAIVRYRVVVNGNLSEIIIPTRGLPQGDPLSPYLFILCAEGLSYLISKKVAYRSITPCMVARGAPGISHLFFQMIVCYFFRLQWRKRMKCVIVWQIIRGCQANL